MGFCMKYLCAFVVFHWGVYQADCLSSCGNGNGSVEFVVWRDYCYYFHNGMVKFDQAKQGCENIGAKLVSIHSEEENEFIYNSVYRQRPFGIWLGMVKDSVDKPIPKDNYYWLDGTKTDFEKWAPNEPNGALNVEDCVEMFVTTYGGIQPKKHWNDVPCTWPSKPGYVCKVKAVEGWVKNGNSEYFISYKAKDTQLNWYGARQWCMRQGADLASINSAAEAKTIASWASTNAFKGGLWIGANRLKGNQNTWSWSDTSTWSYTNWKANYPDDNNYGQYCAYQESSDLEGKWMNSHCDDATFGFICKRPSGVAPTPKTDPATPSVVGFCPAGFIGSGPEVKSSQIYSIYTTDYEQMKFYYIYKN